MLSYARIKGLNIYSDFLFAGTLASGSEGGDLCLWSVTGELLCKYNRPDTDCTSVLFSKLNQGVLYGAFSNLVLIFEKNQLNEPVHTFNSNQEEINQLQFDDKEQFLAACDDSGEIKIFSLSEKKVFKTLCFTHTNICSTVLFRPERPWEIISGGFDCRLIHWKFSTGKSLNQFNMQELHSISNDVSTYLLNPPFVHHLARNESGSIIACALENGMVAVFDGTHTNLKEMFCLHAHEQGVSQVQFHGANMLISGGNDSRIIVWDLSKAEQYEDPGFMLMMNGESSREDRRNESITGLCKVKVIVHSMKVNWLVPLVRDGQLFVAVADQTCNISIIPLSS